MGFTYRGRHSSEFGLICTLTKRDMLPKPKESVDSSIAIDGEYDFSDYNEDGRIKYESRVIEYECQFLQNDMVKIQKQASRLARWLAGGYDDLVCDDMNTVTWDAKIVNQLDLSIVIGRVGVFTLTFKCNPFAHKVGTLGSSLGSYLTLGNKNYMYGADDFSATWTIRNGSQISFPRALDYKGTNNATLLSFVNNTWKDDISYVVSGLTVGNTYTLSLWAMLGTASNFVISLDDGCGSGWHYLPGGQKVITSGGWQKVSITFVAPSTGKVALFLGSNAYPGGVNQATGSVYVCYFELQEGTSTVEDDTLLDMGVNYTKHINGAGTIQVNNTGTWFTKPIIEITGGFGNLTMVCNGKTLIYDSYLPGGQKLIFDCENKTVTTGQGINATEWVSGDFPELIPGTNDISFYGSNIEFDVLVGINPQYIYGEED